MKKQLLLLSIFTINVLAAQVPNYIPTNGLVGYWPFSGNANDVSGNGNNGTVSGATLTTDRFGNTNSAYSFSNSSILITNQFYNNGWPNYSISLWFLTNNNNQRMQMIFNTTPHDGEGFSYCHNNRPNLFSHWKNENPNNHSWNIFSANPLIYNPINNLVWYNLVIIKNGNTYSYYVNGVFDKSSTTTISALNQLTGVRFGSIGGAEYLNGKLDDIGIWNRALTQAEITGLFTTLGTEQNLANSQITVYPNPAKEQITIDCGNLSNTSGWSYKIVNTLGQEVLKGEINSQQNVVSLNSLNGSGVYLVKIYDASNNLLNTKKIVLQ
jgi:hypothetical protein